MSTAPERMAVEVYASVGGAAFFERLQAEWRCAGATVTPHHGISQEDYRRAKGWTGRAALRWRMYPGFAWKCWREARRGGGGSTVRVVTTNPFFAPALIARLSRGRGATVNLLYDLFPEALIQTGTIGADTLLARRCAAITRFALRECTATVFLGARLRAHAEAIHGPARRGVVIPVGADGRPFRNFPPQESPPGARPRILYSGQMGRMHDVDTLLAAWGRPEAAGVDWVFHATGTGYDRLRRAPGAPAGVIWGAGLPEVAWQEAMKRAAVALVTIAAGGERVVMPSKTYSALVAGQAILAICRRDSDLADLVVRHDCGWVVEPGDYAGLVNILTRVADHPDELMAKRQNSFVEGHRLYDMTPVAAEWTSLFSALQAP